MLNVQTGPGSSIGEAAGGFSSVKVDGGSQEALYTKEGVLRHFEEVFESLELKRQIADLGCGLNSFFTKKRSLLEFTAMSIALWRLALKRSFPDEIEEFFHEFLETSKILGKGKKRVKMIELVNTYNVLFAPKKTDDFSAISQYMADILGSASADRKTLQLKLSLTIRKMYQMIFDHLL